MEVSLKQQEVGGQTPRKSGHLQGGWYPDIIDEAGHSFPNSLQLYPDIIDEVRQYFPNSLQYLSWNRYPHWCLPETFEANNLVILEICVSNIKQLWNEGRVMKKLKFLFLGFTKLESLDLGLMPNLERLNLECCFYLVKLYVHDIDGCLKNLAYLSLSGCKKLRSLDLGMMPNLERLNLKDCYDLVKLDVYGGCLKSLVYLNLSGCKNLKSFLFIELLESLEVLYFGSWNLNESPYYIITGQSNNSLLELHLFGMNDTEEVHPSIGSLHNLVSLCFSNCSRLEILLERMLGVLHQTEEAEKLKLSNAFIKHLLGSICKLKHLKTLIFHWCKFREMLPDDVAQFESLEKLDLSGCRKFRDIPSSICESKHLKDLDLSDCRKLEKLPDGRFAMFEIIKY